MIANRKVFVIRQQRIVGAKQLPHIGGVENRCVKIGVVANDCGHKHLNLSLRDQMPCGSLPIGGGRILAQDSMKTPAQSTPWAGSKRHQRIQRMGSAGIRRNPRARLLKQALASQTGDVKNAVSDRNPRSRLRAGIAPPKNSEG